MKSNDKKIKRSQLVNIIKEEMMRMNENIFCDYNRQQSQQRHIRLSQSHGIIEHMGESE